MTNHLPALLAAADTSKMPSVGYGALIALVVFILASLWIGALANRRTREGSFMTGFFLGNRGLGAWALALTATVQSGGTFMGFPSLVYTHGWIVALWIGGYIVVPITGFGILGKRLAQLSRRTEAITVPDLFRSRFGSPALGLVASLFILLYLSFMMFAQFKAGAIVMKTAWPGSGVLSVNEDQKPFTLTAQSLSTLKDDGLSDVVADKLTPLIGHGFSTERELTAQLKSLLTADELTALYRGKPFEGHKDNFFRCIRDGGLPVSDVFSHLITMNTCHLTAIAARLGRSISWDPAAEAISGDEQAQALTARTPRAGYEIPRV